MVFYTTEDGGMYCRNCELKVCSNCYTSRDVDDLYCMSCSTSCCNGHNNTEKNSILHSSGKCASDERGRIDAEMDKQRERSTMPEYIIY